MSEKKSLVEEALLQMKNLEHVVTENAKGILASTMKEEIEELVKESLEEAEMSAENESWSNEEVTEDELVEIAVGLGFEKELVKKALILTKNDIEAAIDILTTNPEKLIGV